jgi:Lysyl oxidase
MWPLALIVILGAGLLGGRATSAPSSPEPGDVYLPDLRTLDPSEFKVGSDGDTRRLFLSNTVWNAGNGPLEIRPENDTSVEPPVTRAYQILFTENAVGDLLQLEHEHPAGSFAFHPLHDHWHFQGLARYELARMKPDGTVGEVVAWRQKIGFCMFDQRQIDGTLENAQDSPQYSGFSCDENNNVGYSVGWGDEYPFNFAEQDIDITGVPPGKYWVVSTADPEKLVRETNNRNNGAKAAIRLTETDVYSITDTTASICSPCGTTDLTKDKRYFVEGLTHPSPGPRPATSPTIDLSYKRRGTEGWKPFGAPDSDRAFKLNDENDGPIAFDGSWDRYFFAHKRGDWVVRARYEGNDFFTGSAEKIAVTVGD